MSAGASEITDGIRLRLATTLAYVPPTKSDGTPDRDRSPPPKPARRQVRLSDWLLGQKPTERPYLLGLSWRVPEEVPSQTALRLELLAALSADSKTVTAGAEAVTRMRAWLGRLPVTGRVPISVPDARWLQVNPSRDPVLRTGDVLVLPQRPRTVTVVSPEGALCRVEHRGGYEASAYLAACGITSADWAWIAQPDGKVQRFGIAAWNAERQDEIAPGAWIWGPPRGSGWPESFSERLIRFLATQGPALDSDEGPAACGPGGAAGGMQSGPLAIAGGVSAPLDIGAAAEPACDESSQSRPPATAATLGPAPPTRSRGLEPTASDWGSVGLLQTPTARMRRAGHFTFHYSHATPYVRGNLFVQPFDWMEAGFRYTEVTNQPYGLGLDQTFKDKGIDVKFRLWPESAYVPQIAVGAIDIAGTGLFSGEYLVASKRTGDFDWSLGIGWGYSGARGNIRNPLSSISTAFDRREPAGGPGGQLAFKSYFRGPAALFGGVQYQTPWERLVLKAEYEGNDYRNEPFGADFNQRSPINVGAVYRATSWADVTLGFERGNRLMFGLTIHSALDRLSQPKLSDPQPVAVAPGRPAKSPNWAITSRDLQRQTDWQVGTIEQREGEVRVVLHDADAVYWRSRVDRAAAVLHRDAPASVDRFTLAYRRRGVDLAEHVIDREAWVTERTQTVPGSTQWPSVIAQPPALSRPEQMVDAVPLRRFDYGVGLSYGQVLGGPDAFILYDLSAIARAQVRLREDTWVQGALRLRLLDNYDRFTVTGPSVLPRVRTFQREYRTTSELTMPNLQLTHVGALQRDHYYSVYGGYLEDVFAGVGGEWLYRPFASSLAFGVDINAVRQREFSQHFGFRDYSTVTGHGAVYWDTGWNDVLVTLRAGRYLARDVGATLELSRVFRNGVRVGAFATKTNLSAEEFGEGSFDKGVFLSIPFDAVFTRSTNSYATFLWRPIVRDGGAFLARAVSLYNITSVRSDRTLQRAPPTPPNDRLTPADRRQDRQAAAELPPAYTRVTPKLPAAQWERPSSIDQHRLASTMYAQGFRKITVDYDTSHRLSVTASSDRLSPIGRAAGRAARTALLQAPLEAREIEITLLDGTTQQARYEFFDLKRLQRYFDGEIDRNALRDFVKVEWLNPAAAVRDPLAGLDDLEPAAPRGVLADLVPDTFSVGRVASDFAGAAQAAAKIDWLRAGAIGAGLVLGSSALDKRAHRYAQDYADSRWLTRGVDVGNAIPVLGFIAAGAAALDGSDPRRSRTGYAAVEAGASAFVLATGLKYAFGRARPTLGLGRHEFNWLSAERNYDAFPSRHTAVAWALATPFALEYDMPWLYGIAALTNLARIGSREHWVSDTVAGSFIGYGLGRLFWHASRDQAKGEPKVLFDGSGIGLLWGW